MHPDRFLELIFERMEEEVRGLTYPIRVSAAELIDYCIYKTKCTDEEKAKRIINGVLDHVCNLGYLQRDGRDIVCAYYGQLVNMLHNAGGWITEEPPPFTMRDTDIDKLNEMDENTLYNGDATRGYN